MLITDEIGFQTLDRPLHHCRVVNIDGRSCRLSQLENQAARTTTHTTYGKLDVTTCCKRVSRGGHRVPIANHIATHDQASAAAYVLASGFNFLLDPMGQSDNNAGLFQYRHPSKIHVGKNVPR